MISFSLTQRKKCLANNLILHVFTLIHPRAWLCTPSLHMLLQERHLLECKAGALVLADLVLCRCEVCHTHETRVFFDEGCILDQPAQENEFVPHHPHVHVDVDAYNTVARAFPRKGVEVGLSETDHVAVCLVRRSPHTHRVVPFAFVVGSGARRSVIRMLLEPLLCDDGINVVSIVQRHNRSDDCPFIIELQSCMETGLDLDPFPFVLDLFRHDTPVSMIADDKWSFTYS